MTTAFCQAPAIAQKSSEAFRFVESPGEYVDLKFGDRNALIDTAGRSPAMYNALASIDGGVLQGRIVDKFGGVFNRAAGTPESLARESIRSGQRLPCARDNPLGISAT